MDQELVQYLDERFGEVTRQFERIDRRFEQVDGRFEQIDGRFEQIDQRLERVDDRFDEVSGRIEEVKRHSGVLVEGLRLEVHLLAEGLATHIDVRHAEDRAYADQRFRETHALIRLAYESHEQLRQRVENIERKERG